MAGVPKVSMDMTERPSEDDLIARYFAPLAGEGGLALKDDAARLTPPPGDDLVITVDGLVGGVHFFADDSAGDIARKTLRVNLSDLAAKGARPLGFLLTLALPSDWTGEWLAAFAAGLGDDALVYGCPLLGGDTVKTPGPLTLSITALGAVRHGKMVLRTGARVGDLIYATGTIGDSALGLRARFGRLPPVSESARGHLLDRYLLPRPRLALAKAMSAHASGGMDISDGFVGDLVKMLRVSGVTAEVDLARLPLSEAAREAIEADAGLFEIAATGGDDYELLASVPPSQAAAFEAAAAAADVPATRVGEVQAGSAPPRFQRDGREMVFPRGAFSHF
jgi:thiamine-monophosphate kinase